MLNRKRIVVWAQFFRHHFYVPRRTFIASIGVSLFLWLASLFFGWSTNFIGNGMQFPDSTYMPWAFTVNIFLANGAAVLALYSGVITFGFVTLVNVFVLGIFAGAIIRGAVMQFGFPEAWNIFFPFFAFEWLGLFLVTVAALMPVVHLLTSFPIEKPTIREVISAYARHIPVSLWWCMLAIFVIFIAALFEVGGGLPQ